MIAAGWRREGTRRGFSFVELVLTIGIVALIASISITIYSAYRAGALVSATRGDLDAIGKAVESWQMRNKAAFPHVDPPVSQDREGKAPVDPWGNPYRVDPQRGLIYSFGPDGEDQEGGGDDVTRSYPRLAHDRLRAPEELKVIRQEADRVTLGWRPVLYTGGTVIAYDVQRRDSTAPQWVALPGVAGTSLTHTDEGLSDRRTYYYRVRARTAETEGPWAGPLGYRIVSSSGVVAELSPLEGSCPEGTEMEFRIAVRGSGAALRKVSFDGEELPIEEGRVDRVVRRRFDRARQEILVLRAEDTMGNVESRRAEILVVPAE